jgi:hypothetical protein
MISCFHLVRCVLKCQYNGFDCSIENFISFLSPIYGLCYTFNNKVKNLPNGGVRDANENGGNGKLQLQLYAHSNQYVHPIKRFLFSFM